MLTDVLVRNRLKPRWAQWRVCLCHDASSLAISCHFLQAQALGAELDFVHRIGFGLAAFAFHGFQATCLRFQLLPVQQPSFSANTCTARSKRTSLHVSSSPESPRSYNAFFLRGQIVLRPHLLVMNQRTLMQAEDVVLRGEKENRVRILNCPLASG